MRINFLVNEVFDGWEPTDTRLGGTEESVVKWAEELVKRGHEVYVYKNGKSAVQNNDVWYFRREDYLGNASYDSDLIDGVCINVKTSEIKPIQPTLYLTNETDATKKDLSKYDGVIWPSQWADENIPVNNPRRFILPHGYDSDQIYPSKKIPKQCFYASSPDRGLDTLLEAWPAIHEAHPDATLILTYGVTGVDLPGVICLGDADDDTMNEIYRTSEYWLHPCSGGELFGITGIKAQAAGCWPIYIPTMALAETVKFGTKSTKETFEADVIRELGEEHTIPKLHFPNWQETAVMLEEIIKDVV